MNGYDLMGYDLQQILPAAASAAEELTRRGLAYKESSEETRRAIAADAMAKNALGQSLYTKSPDDAKAAEVALAQADTFQLGPDSAKKRLDAARRMVDEAQRDYQNKAGKGGEAARSAVAYLQAAQQIATRVAGAQIASPNAAAVVSTASSSATSATSTAPASSSFFTRNVLGPIPGWGVVVGLVTVVGALGTLLLRRKS